MIFFPEITLGISSNSILPRFPVVTFFQALRHKPSNTIIGVSALSHIMMLLVLAMAVTAAHILGSQGFGDDFTCKSVISLYRLMRGVSICATCHLRSSMSSSSAPEVPVWQRSKVTPFSTICVASFPCGPSIRPLMVSRTPYLPPPMCWDSKHLWFVILCNSSLYSLPLLLFVESPTAA